MLSFTKRHKKQQEIKYLYLLKKLGGWNNASHVDLPIKTSLVIVRPGTKKGKFKTTVFNEYGTRLLWKKLYIQVLVGQNHNNTLRLVSVAWSNLECCLKLWMEWQSITQSENKLSSQNQESLIHDWDYCHSVNRTLHDIKAGSPKYFIKGERVRGVGR